MIKKLLASFALAIFMFLNAIPIGQAVTPEEALNEWTDCSKNKNNAHFKYCIKLQEPINGQNVIVGDTGYDVAAYYISMAYKYGASIIGIFCVFVIIASGIQISMGGANSEMVNQGKERILQALLSLILLFSSALILKTVNPGFFI